MSRSWSLRNKVPRRGHMVMSPSFSTTEEWRTCFYQPLVTAAARCLLDRARGAVGRPLTNANENVIGCPMSNGPFIRSHLWRSSGLTDDRLPGTNSGPAPGSEISWIRPSLHFVGAISNRGKCQALVSGPARLLDCHRLGLSSLRVNSTLLSSSTKRRQSFGKEARVVRPLHCTTQSSKNPHVQALSNLDESRGQTTMLQPLRNQAIAIVPAHRHWALWGSIQRSALSPRSLRDPGLRTGHLV